jgi:PAS domain S-box-containing protein
MRTPVKLLYIEDDELDRRAFLRMVREKGLPYDTTTAATLAEARARLAESGFDVIVADNHLPDGESSELFGEITDIPFVLVTGTLEEQLALRTLERGADDYLVKDPEHRYLEALPFAVEKTLYRKAVHDKEKQLTRELRESEQRLRATFDNAASGIIRADQEDRLVDVNDRLCQMLGYRREELLGMRLHDLTWPEDRPRSDELHAQLREGRSPMLQYEKRYLKRDGSPLWVHAAGSAVRDEAGSYLYSVGTVVDISARKAAEAQMRLQAAALDAAPNAISLSKTDLEGTIAWVNSAFTTLTGYSADEAVGQTHRLLHSGRQDAAFYRALWETIRRGEVWRGELVNRRKDGTLYTEEMGITPLRDENGQITHYVAVKQDITERKRTEEALRRSEALYRTMARNIPEGAITVVDRNLCYLLVEGKLLHRLGLSKEGVEGRRVQEVLQGEIGQIRAEYFGRALAGEPSSCEMEYHERNIWSQFVPLRDEQGQVWAAMCLSLDITHRKQAEAEILALRDRLAEDLAGMNRLHAVSTRFVSQDGLQSLLDAILDAALAITGADKGNLQLLTPGSGELSIAVHRGFDQAFVEFFSHIRAGQVACGTAMQTRQCVVVEDITLSPLFLSEPRALQLKLAAGVRAIVCTPLLTRAGQLVGVLSVHFGAPHRPSERELHLLDLLARQAADFVEHAQAEEALRQREWEFRALAETVPQIVWATRPDGWNTYFNQQWVDYTGLTLEESYGHGWNTPFHPDDKQRAWEAWQRATKQNEAYSLECRLRRFDGVYRWWLIRGAPMRSANGDIQKWFGTCTDIEEIKQAEEAQARLAAIVEWSEDAIVSKTLEGKIRTWNAGAERMFGYRAEEVIGRPVTLLIPPERLDEENQVLERIRRGEPVEHYETVRVTKDGRRLDVSLTISPVKDSQGRIVGASKIARDIGDIVRARQVLARSKEDLERLVDERTAKLREAMGELEHMSYSMVHDMRAPLRAMQGFAAVLEEECAGRRQPPALDYLRRIRESANRLDRLITGALNYNLVVRQELPVTAVEVGRLVRGMVETYPNLQAPAADIEVELNELVVLGNESLLTQCFGNLLGNAVKFVTPGVTPHIRVWAEMMKSEILPGTTEQALPSAASANPQPSTLRSPATEDRSTRNPLVRIWVEDNGIGIPGDAQEKIFRMFQRMHRADEYPGTGIGLAIVRKAVERMGGCVGLASEPGKGSKFWIALPTTAEAEKGALLAHAA